MTTRITTDIISGDHTFSPETSLFTDIDLMMFLHAIASYDLA